jgi:hypothetical protein
MGEWGFLTFRAFAAGWILLQRVILPRAGVEWRTVRGS